jgi:hypothetical protein
LTSSGGCNPDDSQQAGFGLAFVDCYSYYNIK